MRIGITGSHGFIGQHLACFLSKRRDLKIRRFDRKKHDLSDISSLRPFVKDLDVLYHLAGANRAENADLIRINFLGTSNLVDATKRYGNPDKIKIIFASSFQVYAPRKTEEAVDEKVPADPQTLFGIAKRSAEDLLRLSGINTAVARISNTYGPLCRPFYNSVISTFCELVRRDKEIQVNGDGSQSRDFIFIEDVVHALEKLAEHSFRGTQTYNLCGGKLYTLKDIIQGLEEASGKKIRAVYNKNAEPRLYLRGDNRKIKRAIGWKPEIPFREGLEKTYRWFEKQPY